MKIDLGALAKGYIADKIMDYLKTENVSSAMINLGGNVLVYGDNPKREMVFGILVSNIPKNNVATILVF